MKKLIISFMLVAGIALAQTFYPVQYDTATDNMSYSSDGTNTNVLFGAQATSNALALHDCLPKKGNRPILDWQVGGGVVTAIVDVVEGDGVLTMVFNEMEYDFATPTNLVIANGATNVQQFSYIYVTTNGITNSTTFPSGEYGMLFDLSVLDAAKTASDGLFTLRRWTDNAAGPADADGRSVIQRATERIRAMPATWISGGALDSVVQTVGGGDDNVYLTSAAGTSYQFNPQTFSAVSATNGTEQYHVYNDPDLTYAHITNLNQITKDSSGNAVNNNANRYFNVAVMRHFPSGTTNQIDSALILKLSSDDYADEDRALADADGLLDFTVPSRMVGETLVLGFVTLNRTSVGGGTWTAQVTSRLGQEVGTAGGGASSLPQTSTFIDSAFTVEDDGDPTKKIQLEASEITTATTRTYTMPDVTGRVHVDGMTNDAYYSGNVGIGAASPASDEVLTVQASASGDKSFAGYDSEGDIQARIQHVNGEGGLFNLYSGDGVTNTVRIDGRAGRDSWILRSGDAGQLGIKDNTPSYDLDVNGTARFTGKVTLSGGSDPPYQHLWEQTLAAVTNRVALEVPPCKYAGTVNAFIEDENATYWWQPSSGNYVKLDNVNGTFTKGSIAGWTNNMAPHEWRDEYYLDQATGQLIHDQIAVSNKTWQIKDGFSLDEATGLFYDAETNEVTKAEAIELR